VPPGASPQADSSIFEDDEPTLMKPTGAPTATMPPSIVTPSEGATAVDEPLEMTIEPLVRERADDSALGQAIDAALDKEEEAPPAK
jgi:hypothetical protein